MPKMTKAQARRRLTEAGDKLAKVWMSSGRATVGLSTQDLNKLIAIRTQLQNMAKKLK